MAYVKMLTNINLGTLNVTYKVLMDLFDWDEECANEVMDGKIVLTLSELEIIADWIGESVEKLVSEGCKPEISPSSKMVLSCYEEY